MKSHRMIAVLLAFAGIAAAAGPAKQEAEQPWSERAANAAILRWPDGSPASAGVSSASTYELGALLDGMAAVWLRSADGRYYNYIQDSVDRLVSPDGSIPTWNAEASQLDSAVLGRQLLLLYRVTLDQRYATAATLLYRQLVHQSRDPSGVFSQKKNPHAMSLNRLSMAEPFYAEYASTFHLPEAFHDITRQFVLMDEQARDSSTGLLFDAPVDSKQKPLANQQTRLSSQFSARAMGWHIIALVDTLDFYAEDDPGRKELLTLLDRDAAAVVRYQDGASGLWRPAFENRGRQGNYLEAPASCIFVYALARGVRRGYLPPRYLENAQRGYRGILDHLVQSGPGDDVALSGTANSVGPSGDPVRDGIHARYVGDKTDANGPMGVGSFLLASAEMETAANARLGRGKTVLLDAWFNSQKRTDAGGRPAYFHYKWDDFSNSGYSFLGNIFQNFGAQTATLYQAPTRAALSRAQIYIIVSPDIPAKNPDPHYVSPEDAAQVADWVKNGGVLVIMENDPGNADLEHTNLLSDRFGIHFNNVLRNRVDGNRFEMGKVAIDAGGPIFHRAHTAYMKEICTISVQPPAIPLLRDRGDILMATARYGRGTVYATVDPWLYNEYTDGRKLPATFDNFSAGQELVRWILEQVQIRY